MPGQSSAVMGSLSTSLLDTYKRATTNVDYSFHTQIAENDSEF